MLFVVLFPSFYTTLTKKKFLVREDTIYLIEIYLRNGYIEFIELRFRELSAGSRAELKEDFLEALLENFIVFWNYRTKLLHYFLSPCCYFSLRITAYYQFQSLMDLLGSYNLSASVF